MKIIKTANSVINRAVKTSFIAICVVSVSVWTKLCAELYIALRQANATVKPIAAMIARRSCRRNSFLNDLFVLKYFIDKIIKNSIKNYVWDLLLEKSDNFPNTC
jgi:hypothetical protein